MFKKSLASIVNKNKFFTKKGGFTVIFNECFHQMTQKYIWMTCPNSKSVSSKAINTLKMKREGAVGCCPPFPSTRRDKCSFPDAARFRPRSFWQLSFSHSDLYYSQTGLAFNCLNLIIIDLYELRKTLCIEFNSQSYKLILINFESTEYQSQLIRAYQVLLFYALFFCQFKRNECISNLKWFPQKLFLRPHITPN